LKAITTQLITTACKLISLLPCAGNLTFLFSLTSNVYWLHLTARRNGVFKVNSVLNTMIIADNWRWLHDIAHAYRHNTF